MKHASAVTLDLVRAALQRPLPGLRGQVWMAPSHRPTDPDYYARGARNCRRAAVLFLLFPVEGELHTVLTVRPKHLPDHPGQVAFPGGAKDGDESVEQTALREAQEEVGLDPALVEPLGRLTHIYIPPSNFCIQIVVGYASERPQWKPNPKEVATLLEPPVTYFFDPAHRDAVLVEVNGQKRRIPYFCIEGHRVWGATAMAIAEFVTAVEEARNGRSIAEA
ncbi:MAG: CoA pyrophosphatase [Chloroflexi bacterium]|nr:CoA pyrophosphatase [Chloroflexota bacterium]